MNDVRFDLQRFAGSVKDDGNLINSIINTLSNTRLIGTSGDDYIYNDGKSSKSSLGNNVTINAGGGNDSIRNYYGWYSVFNGEGGNDTIFNDIGVFATINGGDGNDLIYNSTSTQSSILGGTGNDSIFNVSQSATINAGAGNDFISLEANNSADEVSDEDWISIIYEAGNDTICGFNFMDTLHIPSASYSTTRSGSDVIVNVGSGSITFKDVGLNAIQVCDALNRMSVINYGISNYESRKTVNGTASADRIFNAEDYVAINTGAGNDSVFAYFGEHVTINAGEGDNSVCNFDGYHVTVNTNNGNDTVLNYFGSFSSINTGNGDDSVRNEHNGYTQINTGAGDDTITNFKSCYIRINPGAGNDFVSLNSDEDWISIIYADGDGDDTITGFDICDTLRITSDTYTTTRSGSDVIVKVGNGSIRLLDAINRPIDIVNVNDIDDLSNSIINARSNTLVSGTDGADSIKNTGSDVTIQGKGGNDTIQDSGSGALIDAGDGNDSIQSVYRATVYGGAGDDTIKSDAGVIFGDAGNDLLTLNGRWQNASVNGGTGDDTITVSKSTNPNYGIKYLYASGDGNDIIYGSDLLDTIILTDGADYSTLKSGNDILVSMLGGSITLKDALEKTITISDGSIGRYIYNSNAATLISGTELKDTIRNEYADGATISGGAGNDLIYNSGASVSIDGGAGADTIDNQGNVSYLDGGTGNDVIVSNKDVLNGSRVTIRGGAGSDTISGSASADVYLYAEGDGNDLITNYDGTDTIRITDGAEYSTLLSGDDVIVNIGSGMILLRDAANQTLNISNVAVDTGDGGSSINAIVNTQSNKLVVGTSGRDSIKNSGSKVTIQSNAGNDTIVGSDNAEWFLFSSAHGNNLITNFGTNDSLRMTAGKTITYKKSGADMIVTLKGASYTGVETLKGAGSYNFKTSGNVLYVASSINTINNTSNNKLVVGTSGADSIKNSGSKVTIQANAGDDTIVGSSNAELFLFSSADGNNLITNFGTNDSLKMTAGMSISYAKSGADMIVTLKGASYTGVETLKGAGSYNFKTSGNVLYVGSSINTINNTRSNTLVSGSSGDDYIINSGSGVSIQANAGDDTIVGSDNAEWFLFSSAHGNNLITNFGTNDSLKMTAGMSITYAKSGADMIVTLKGASYTGVETLKGAGSYNFKTSGNVLYVEPEASGDVNYIVNSSDGVKVSGTSGNDYIINTGSNVTIQANGGRDTIESSEDYGDLFLFSSADGNNLITNFDSNDTLRMTAGQTLSFATVGADVIVTLKGASYTGIETLRGAAGLNFQKSGSYLIAPNVNRIINTRDNVKVSGTSRADYITNSGERVTLEGKGGDDTIVCSDFGELILFGSDGGRDVVTNFGSNDTLRITAGSIQSMSKSGSDYVVDVKGANYAGSIVLGGAGDFNFVRSGSYVTVDAVNRIVNRSDNVKVVGTSGRDYITNSGSGVSIQAGAGADTIEGSDFGELFLFSSADGNNFITNFGRNDTLQMTAGLTLSYSTVGADVLVTLKGASYTGTIKLLDAADYPFKQSGNKLTVNAFNVINRSADKIKIAGTDGADSITSSGQNVTIQSNAGADTITGSDSFGDLFLFSSAHGNNLITNFGKNDSLKMTAGQSISYKKSGADMIVTLKGASYTGVETLKGAGDYEFVLNGNVLSVNNVNEIINNRDNVKVSGTSGDDRILNNGENVTIQGNAGNDTIEGSSFGELFLFSSADGQNVITNFGANDSLKMTAGQTLTYAKVGADAVVSLKGAKYSGTITLSGAGEYEFVKSGNVLTAKTEVEPIVNSSDGVRFSGTSSNDYMINSGSNVTINASGGDDTIESANDGSELFQFGASDGNDIIYNFGTNDTLRITLGEITSYYASGSDYVVNVERSGVSSGSVTLKNVGAISVSNKNIRATRLNSQLPTEVEDYWFEQNDQAVDEINSILAVENNHVDFDLDQIDRIKVSAIEIVESSARRQAKK